MLNARKCRKGHTAHRSVQLFYRQRHQLEGPSIESKRVRSPETTEQEFLRVPRKEYYEAVTGGQSSKMEHRQDAGPALWWARNPGDRDPYRGGADDCDSHRHAHQGPVTATKQRHDDACRGADSKGQNIDLCLRHKSHATPQQSSVL